MQHFTHAKQDSFCEGVSLTALAATVGTPSYIYTQSGLTERLQEIQSAFASYPTLPCYAVKANSNLSLLRLIFAQGFGADLVSHGEYQRAQKAGCSTEQIVYSGVGKTEAELAAALAGGLLCFNVESSFELDMLRQLAQKMGRGVRIALRLNPDIDAGTHPKIATGLYGSKFGMPLQQAVHLADSLRHDPLIQVTGIACHIGSQILDLAPLAAAAKQMAKFAQKLVSSGHALTHIDMGGGLGIAYAGESTPSLKDYAQTLIDAVRPSGLRLIIEPGRLVMGEQGILLVRVIGIKDTPARRFVVVDGAMNDLIRPSLYEAHHEIVPVRSTTGPLPQLVDIVGPICETGDYLGLGRTLPEVAAGELLMVCTTGAYGMSMASQYNSRPRAAEVLVHGAQWQIIRKRETYDDLWRHEENLQ